MSESALVESLRLAQDRPLMLDWRSPDWRTTPSSPLRSRLRTARVSAGLSLDELAAAVATTRQTIAAVESGRSSPSPALAHALARELGVTVEQLFTADDLR